MSNEFIPGWNPQDDICLVIDDKTAEVRSDGELKTMFEQIRSVIGQYGFDISQHGTRAGFARFFHTYYQPDGQIRDVPYSPPVPFCTRCQTYREDCPACD